MPLAPDQLPCGNDLPVHLTPDARIDLLRVREPGVGVHVERRERVGNRRGGDVRGLGVCWLRGRRLGFGLIWGRSHSEHPLWRLPGLRRFACVGRVPLPMADFRQVLAVFVDVLLVLDQLILELLLETLSTLSSVLRNLLIGVPCS